MLPSIFKGSATTTSFLRTQVVSTAQSSSVGIGNRGVFFVRATTGESPPKAPPKHQLLSSCQSSFSQNYGKPIKGQQNNKQQIRCYSKVNGRNSRFNSYWNGYSHTHDHGWNWFLHLLTPFHNIAISLQVLFLRTSIIYYLYK